jgi:NADPH:quinone reductase-like Zn-dependent oxidoreductase
MKAFGLADESSTAAMLEVPTPEAGPGEVRVTVRASSVNGWDVFVMSGHARAMMEHHYPVIGGKDFAGVIDAVGEGATGFAVGDEVLGIVPNAPFLSVGSYAESLVVPSEGFIQPKPSSLDFEQAASVGLAALTALVSVDAIEASDGDVVLIVGAAGGVGSYAVELAAARGATVVATARPDDEEWIRGLGAAEAIDYSGDVAAAVRDTHPDGVDGLIVAVNLGDAFGPTASLVKDGGKIASTVGGADAVGERDIRATNVQGQSDNLETFAEVVRLAAAGTLTVPITRTFTFDELPEALGLVGETRSRGKFAITISS